MNTVDDEAGALSLPESVGEPSESLEAMESQEPVKRATCQAATSGCPATSR